MAEPYNYRRAQRTKEVYRSLEQVCEHGCHESNKLPPYMGQCLTIVMPTEDVKIIKVLRELGQLKTLQEKMYNNNVFLRIKENRNADGKSTPNN